MGGRDLENNNFLPESYLLWWNYLDLCKLNSRGLARFLAPKFVGPLKCRTKLWMKSLGLGLEL